MKHWIDIFTEFAGLYYSNSYKLVYIRVCYCLCHYSVTTLRPQQCYLYPSPLKPPPQCHHPPRTQLCKRPIITLYTLPFDDYLVVFKYPGTVLHIPPLSGRNFDRMPAFQGELWGADKIEFTSLEFIIGTLIPFFYKKVNSGASDHF